MPGLQFNAYSVSKVVKKVHDFVPDLKVDRFMPLICRQRIKLLVRTEAKLLTYFSYLTISLKLPLFTLAYFSEIQLPFSKSATKTLKHMQSTSNNIFLWVPLIFSHDFLRKLENHF